MSRFLRFCAFLFVLFFSGNVLAAGYTCPTTSYKKYTSCSAGYYMTYNGTYNGTPRVGNACTKCTSDYECEGGTADRVLKNIVCSAGYYLPANSTTCTICPAGSYCPGGSFDPVATTSNRGINSCPAASGSYLDTYTDMQTWVKSACPDSTSSNTSIIKAAITSWDSKKGKSTITGCGVDYTLNTPCGTVIKENVPYNTSTGKYDTYVNSAEVGLHFYNALAAGYYLKDVYSSTYCNTSTHRMLYATAVKCPGGGLYCPGFTGSTIPLCNNTAGWTYGEPMGMYGCGTGAASSGDGDDYWSSATGADARTDCYINVRLAKNGGSGSITGNSTVTGTTDGLKTCYYNTACTLPSASALTQTGYKFSGGWGTTSSATSCSNSITLTSAKVAETSYYACKNPTYSITLNKNNGGSAGGTSTLYTTKTVGVYLNSARTQSLTTAGTYKVTMPTWAPEYYHSESEYPVTFDARPALGYYSSSDGGTQYVNASGVITSAGLTAAKGYGANATWHAQYDTMVTAPDAPADKSGYTFRFWCAISGENDCVSGAIYPGDEFDLNDLIDGTLYAVWAPHTTIRITHNGENGIGGVTNIYATEWVEGVYLDAAHTKKMTTTANPITYPDHLYTWDVSFTDSYTGTDITKSVPSADPSGVYDSNGTQMINSQGYITSAGIAAAEAVTATYGDYDASWGMSWTMRPDACVTVPDAPTRAGYVFNGWESVNHGLFQPGETVCYQEHGETSLVANWTANKYTITLDNANATTNGTSSVYVVRDDAIYLDSAKTKEMTGSANPITVPQRKYTVTYNVNSGSVSPTSATSTYAFKGYYSGSYQIIASSGYVVDNQIGYITATTGSAKTWNAQWTSAAVTLPTPTRTGYTFGGWYSNSTLTNKVGDAGASYTPTANVTLYAKWTANTYTISFDANGGTGGQSADVTATYGSTMPGISTTKPTKAGCKFMGWYDNATYTSGKQYYDASGSFTTVWDKASGGTLYAGWSCMSVTGPSNQSKVYDGAALTCNGGISVSAPSGATVTYATQSSGTCGTYGAAPTRTAAGTTTVCYKITATDYTAKTGTFTCSVAQANGSTTIKDGSTDVTNKSGSTAYPGTKSLTITCAGGATSDITATSGTASVATASVSGTSVALTSKATGSSKITVNCPATTNYKASSATYDWTVTNGTITATVTNPSKTYNGSALSCAGISNVVPSGATVSYAEKSGTTCGTYSSTIPSRTNAGTTNVCYKIEATNYTTKSGEFSCKVNQADNTLTLSVTSGSMPYSSTATFTVSKNTSGGTLSVESSNENCATATISGTTVTISSKANYCTANITVTSAATTNYKTESATYALTVNKGTITLNNRSATSAGTTAIYQTYNTNVYLDNARSKAMTTSANAITVPSRTGYTFGGYYSASNGTGTQYINASGNITSDGLTAGKALQANGTWYAKWTANNYTITLDNAGATTNGTASIYTTYNTNVYLDSSRAKAMTTSANPITKPSRVYTVTYNANSGSVSPTSATSTYTFKGYYSATSNGTQYINASGNITSDGLTAGKSYSAAKTWNAQWTSAAVTLPTPTRTGYTFGGWYKESALTNKVGDAGASYTPTANVTLYAKWTANNYTITLDNAGATTNGTASIYTTYNTNVYLDSSRAKAMTTSANPITKPSRVYTVTYNANSGAVSPTSATSTYTFKGYYSATSNGTQYINASGNITSDGLAAGKGYSAAKTWNAQWTSAAVTLPTPTRTGYTFGGWYKESALTNKVGDAGASYTPTANVTLYAKWTANNYTITLDNAGATTNGTASIYTTYNTNVYLDSSRAKAMTTSANPITKPSRVYTVTYNANSGAVSPTSATSTYTFKGYYSATSNGTQYINASGNITSDGLTAGKGYSAAKTWNAQWTGAAVTLPTPTRTGYTFGGWYKESALTNKVGDAGASYTPTANVTLYAKWTANTDTKYVVNHYTKNLGATTYTLNSAENKTGTTATSVTLANLKKTITGFTYSEGFAGTATKGTTKPASGAVTTATILADGTRVIDLYYTRNTYTITVAAGNGISTVAASGWTNTGSANMTKSYEYGASIALATVVTPTQKTGYTGVAYTKTSGSGTLSGTSFTVGAGTATITAKATAISAPTAALDPSSTTKVYNYQATTLTASNTTSYDSGITVYYKFGNATSADGTYTYGDVGTTNTTSVAATSHRGTKYYKVQVYATDGTLTSSTTTSSAASVTLNNKTITFNATDNGGTLSGTSPLYVSYNNASVYTGSTNTTAGTVPTATKTGYTFNGWYTAKTDGSQIYNASGTLTSTAVSGYTSGSKWVATANKTLYAQFTPCTYTVKFNSNKPSTATSTMSGTMSNQSFTYDAAQNLTANAFSLPGYTFAGWATSSTGSVVHADKKSVSNLTTTCGGTVNLYAKWTANTITLSWANGGRGTAPTSPASCTYDGTFTTPAAMTATGYTFGGWSVNSKTFAVSTSVACTNANLGVYSGTATITGKWTANTYTIVYNANKPSAASASVSGSTASSTHTYDTSKALTSNGFSLTGWSFAGWNTQADGSGTSYSNGASVKNLSATKGAEVNLYAKWTQDCIPVTLNANGGTAGSVTKIYKKADATGWYSDSACATAYTTNANLKPSRSAYTFRGFYVEPVDDISASQTTAITRYLLSDASTSTTGTNWKINAARTLYAGWAQNCVQPSNGTCKFSHGDKAVYTTTCNTGYSISGNATATPSCSIITYTIKYMDGSAEITGLTPATYNVTTATFNLPTAYKATYKFVSWHTDSALSSTAVTQIAKGTTGNKVYYVKWSTCPAGSVCDGDDVVTCPAGSYCPEGASEATPCAKGSYSTGGATTCKLADKGYYVDTTGADKQIACPAGTYGSTTGLTSAACSGKCSAGRYGNATAQTAATCNGACSAGYYCPEGSTSATAYDCDTGKTTASSNNYWTSDSGAGARSSCYRNVVLNKNGMSGTLALPDSSGCKSLDTSTNTLVVYYGKACKLPTTVLSGTATGTTYTGTGTWATSANAANGFVSSITVTSEVATVTYYAGKMYTCSAGYYLKANTNGACTACASPYYCTGISKKYYSSSIQGRSACSALDSNKTDGTYSSVSPYNAATTCRFKQEQQPVPTHCETKISNTMKYTSNGWEANTYSVTAKSGAIISGNNTTGAACSQCAAGTYSAGGTDTTCDAISAGCYGGAGSATACPNQCSAGTYRTSTGGKTQSDCSNVTAGCYGSAGATEACPAVCGADKYSNAGASSCSSCPTDYKNSGDTAASHAGSASCKITVSGGYYIGTAGDNSSNWDKCAGGTYKASHTVAYGSTSSCATCSAGYYCPEGASGQTACGGNDKYSSSGASSCSTVSSGYYSTGGGSTTRTGQTKCEAGNYCSGGVKTACNTVAGKLYTKSVEGSDAATDCYVTLASKVYLAKPTDTATTTCTEGYYCAGGDYHYSSTATNQGRSSCTGATYSGPGAASCTDCPSGYTANTSSNKTANTQCQISVDGGHFIEEAGQNSTNWGTCEAGYAKAAHTVNYGSTSSCAACTGATYAKNEAQPSCTPCPTATNTSAQGVVSSYSYWISGGIHTSRSNCSAYFKTETLEHGTMNIYCYVDANADTYGVDGSSELGCYVRKTGLTCDDGYYNAKFSTLGSSATQYNPGKTIALARASACTAVGEDYYSPAEVWTRTACATGLTTCGSGKCANEAADCGRKLHAGNKVIHLRSAERTSPSLRVKVGDTVFYGNLVSPVDGTLKVKNGTSTYSVANDNQ